MPEHSHCKFCGDPVPFGEEYCEAAEKRRDMLFYVSAGVAVVVILAIGLIFG